MNKIMVGVAALALALTVTNGAGAQQKQSPPPARPKAPRGMEMWRLVSYVNDGKKETPAAKKENVAGVVYNGKGFALALGRTRTVGSYKLDPSKTPMQIDMSLTSGDGKGATVKGIYEVKGGTLMACYAPPGKARPTAFSSTPGSGNRLFVWQMVKAAPPTKGQGGQPAPRGTKGAPKQRTANAPPPAQPAGDGPAPQSWAVTAVASDDEPRADWNEGDVPQSFAATAVASDFTAAEPAGDEPDPLNLAATKPIGAAGGPLAQPINPITAAKDNPALAGALLGAGAAVIAAPFAIAAAPVIAGAAAGADIAAGITAADLAGATELPLGVEIGADGLPFVPGIAF
jgi:uncharacterized protein (TIGR03067 family)